MSSEEWLKGCTFLRNFPLRPLLPLSAPFASKADQSGLKRISIPIPFSAFFKSRAKRTILLRQNFVMPRLCHSKVQFSLFSFIGRPYYIGVAHFTFRFTSYVYAMHTFPVTLGLSVFAFNGFVLFFLVVDLYVQNILKNGQNLWGGGVKIDLKKIQIFFGGGKKLYIFAISFRCKIADSIGDNSL